MADPTSEPHAIWAWMDWVWGFGMGIVATVAGMMTWANMKISKVDLKADAIEEAVHSRINEKADILHGRITAVERLVVELEGGHKATMMLYQTVAEGIKALNQKTDDQTKILHEVVGELKSIQRRSNNHE